MADFGLKTWDSQGNVTLDLTDTISRIRFTTDVAGTTTGSVRLKDIVGKKTAAFSYTLSIPNVSLQATEIPQGNHNHQVTVNGSIVTWSPLGVKHKPAASSTILVFLYD